MAGSVGQLGSHKQPASSLPQVRAAQLTVSPLALYTRRVPVVLSSVAPPSPAGRVTSRLNGSCRTARLKRSSPAWLLPARLLLVSSAGRSSEARSSQRGTSQRGASASVSYRGGAVRGRGVREWRGQEAGAGRTCSKQSSSAAHLESKHRGRERRRSKAQAADVWPQLRLRPLHQLQRGCQGAASVVGHSLLLLNRSIAAACRIGGEAPRDVHVDAPGRGRPAAAGGGALRLGGAHVAACVCREGSMPESDEGRA